MITTFKRPMLAVSLLKPTDKHDDETIFNAMRMLKYPVVVSCKLDGIRAIRVRDSLVSRTLKPIPNESIRARSLLLPEGFDMELWSSRLRYDEIESIVMSKVHPKSDLIQFNVLDDWTRTTLGYWDRLVIMYSIKNTEHIIVPCYMKNTPEDLFEYFKLCEETGEGICFRTPDSPYKQGRSTMREQYLVKLARFIRQEITITSSFEQMENGNEDKYNEVGYMKRTTHQDSMLGKDTLGGFVGVTKDGIEVRVGSGVGWTDNWRKEAWKDRDSWVGKTITIKHKPHGQKDKPRSPVCVGIRRDI